MASSKSYDAFSEVDKLVAKPVLGSDGAAKWQNFQKDSSSSKKSFSSVAPSLPIKKMDRVAGLGNMQEERKQEEKIRKDAGDASMGEGYTVFKRKNDADEQMAKKKRKLIEDRVRPEDVDYFIPSKTFQGWKSDYVFTTKNTHGTGYYWDGMDSVKALLDSTNGGSASEGATTATIPSGVPDEPVKKKKKKKKNKASSTAPVFVDGSRNPMEQVAKAIQRRNQMMQLPPTQRYQQQQQEGQASGAPPSLPLGWERCTDPSTGTEYYFNRSAGLTSWDPPTEDNDTTKKQSGNGSALPSGWSVAKDETTDKEYYYHTNGEVRWERPTK
mmetsp:Transcript_1750/g.2783  ORF Transcript_1750/g.2783 Transcript_1750/m.2783 type:complete len:327 (+) Transcript_1750:62-1042(+)